MRKKSTDSAKSTMQDTFFTSSTGIETPGSKTGANRRWRSAGGQKRISADQVKKLYNHCSFDIGFVTNTMNLELKQMVYTNIKNRFLELVEQNQDIVHKICSLYAVNTDDSKDLSQEIIYQLWKSYQSFRGESKFTTWMYKVSLNTALLNLRRCRNRVRTESLKEHHGDIAAEKGDREKHGKISRLYEAINQLREFDRAIVLLYLEQFSYREISEVIGISEGNVSVRLVRIKKKLKELLK